MAWLVLTTSIYNIPTVRWNGLWWVWPTPHIHIFKIMFKLVKWMNWWVLSTQSPEISCWMWLSGLGSNHHTSHHPFYNMLDNSLNLNMWSRKHLQQVTPRNKRYIMENERTPHTPHNSFNMLLNTMKKWVSGVGSTHHAPHHSPTKTYPLLWTQVQHKSICSCAHTTPASKEFTNIIF